MNRVLALTNLTVATVAVFTGQDLGLIELLIGAAVVAAVLHVADTIRRDGARRRHPVNVVPITPRQRRRPGGAA